MGLDDSEPTNNGTAWFIHGQNMGASGNALYAYAACETAN
jgi:hypothetical protein